MELRGVVNRFESPVGASCAHPRQTVIAPLSSPSASSSRSIGRLIKADSMETCFAFARPGALFFFTYTHRSTNIRHMRYAAPTREALRARARAYHRALFT